MDLAELRALSDDELTRRHDAVAAQDAGGAAHRSTVYLDELRARVAQYEIEKLLRRLLVVLVTFGVLLVATLIVVVVAL